MKKIIIYLTNLTHINDNIPASDAVPLNIGFLAAYTQKVFGNKVEIELFNLPSDLQEAVKRRRPHILGASNYSWNSNLSYYFLSLFKKQYPEIITVMGGPFFSHNADWQRNLLINRKYLDFYISGEGEIAFAELVGVCLKHEMEINKIKSEKIRSCNYLIEDNIVSYPRQDRIKDPNIIPSPYITGLLDKFLNSGFVPLLQTNRGCPFSCAYCCEGVPYYNMVRFFDSNRILDEIAYISERVKNPIIQISDSNFGMFSHDLEYCRLLKKLQETNGWPSFVYAATGKNKKSNVQKCVALLGSSMRFMASVQSLDEEVLKNINRKNICLEDYWDILRNVKKSGGVTYSEVILTLPGETMKSHLEGIKKLMSMEIDIIGTYTTMLLPGSKLYEDQFYEDFKMLRKYRVIPRDFGSYNNKKILEVETVCVGTKDMPLEDYLFLRGFQLVLQIFYNGETFKEILEYLKSFGCEIYDYCYELLTNFNTASEPVKQFFKKFLSDARRELWDSEEDIYSYYADDTNFNKLLSQKEGYNLIQKYDGLFFTEFFTECLEYAIDIAQHFLDNHKCKYSNIEIKSIGKYILLSRGSIFDIIDEDIIMEIPVDVHSWGKGQYVNPISDYHRRVCLRISQTEDQKKKIIDYITNYGDTVDGKGKILTRANPTSFFKDVSILT